MTTRQYLIRRNGVYQFRMRVPPDVAGAFGKTHVQHSLRTTNLPEAGRLRDFWYLKYQTEFNQLRAEPGSEQSPSAYRIVLSNLKPLVEGWLQTQLQLVASEREEDPEPIFDPGEIVEREDEIAHLRADLQRLGNYSTYLHRDVKHLASHFLLSDGAPKHSVPSGLIVQPPDTPDVDEASPEFRRLCAMVHAALHEATRAQLALLEEKPFEPAANLLSEISTSVPTLSEAMAGFLDDRSRRGYTPKLGDDYEMIFRLMFSARSQ